jgi:hypothetical protein
MLPLYDKDIRNIPSGEKANNVEDTLKDTEDMADDMSKGFCLLAQIRISVHEGWGTSLKTNTRNDRHCFLKSNEDCFSSSWIRPWVQEHFQMCSTSSKNQL